MMFNLSFVLFFKFLEEIEAIPVDSIARSKLHLEFQKEKCDRSLILME